MSRFAVVFGLCCLFLPCSLAIAAAGLPPDTVRLDVQRLQSENAAQRVAAALELGNAGTDPAAVTALIAAMKDDNPLVRAQAVISLGMLQPRALPRCSRRCRMISYSFAIMRWRR